MSDIVKRLRECAQRDAQESNENWRIADEPELRAEDRLEWEAADRIEALEAEVAELARERDAAIDKDWVSRQAYDAAVKTARSYREIAEASEARATSLEQRLRDAGVE